ncbi:MAG: sodium/proline symporter [Eubacteriales bacterium]|nr:sodium/proline symporter [Eubacteriales bacterium]
MVNIIVIILVIIAYMAGMVEIGRRLSKRNKSTDDFYLGGRKLGPFVTAMSAEASDMSSWLLMGLPGVALAGLTGGNGTFAEAFWTAAGLALGTYMNWLIVAKPIRIYSEHIHANTIPDFFSNRYQEKKGVLLALSAIIIVVFFVPYTASGFASVGKLFNSMFGINYHTAMILGAIVIAVYTTLGGFLAASTTDLIQSIIMTIALIVVLFYSLSCGGGFSESIAQTEDVSNYFSLNGPDHSFSLLTIFSSFAWGLGYFGMPHILLRFMAIEDDRKLKMSRRIATVWVVISMGVAILIGVIGYSFAQAKGLIGQANFDPERIIIYISSALGKINPFTAILAGLILSGILASQMSTSDSQMLAASSSMSENLIHHFFWKDMPQNKQMTAARLTVLLITVIGIFFAWNPNSSVFRIISFAWAGFGASFGPLVLFSLFWKRTTLQGAAAGIISGGIMVFVWKFGISKLGGIFAIYELLPAFLVSCLFIVVVSLLTPEPSKEITDAFDEVKSKLKNRYE